MQTLTPKIKAGGKTSTGLYKSGENLAMNMLRHLETQLFTAQRSVCVIRRRRIKGA